VKCASAPRLLGQLTILVFFTCGQALAQVSDWQKAARSEVNQQHLDRAAAIVEQQLATDPNDLEARTWRARVLAWQGHWAEAEREYRVVLEKTPTDTEVMAGFADVLTWQGKLEEALSVLDRARATLPLQTYVLDRRARLLTRMGREKEARAEYRAALQLDVTDEGARKGLHGLAGEPRHELRLGADSDTFNYTDAASAQSVTLTSRWNPLWMTAFTSTTYERFGGTAQRNTARITRRIGKSWASIGGGVNHDDGVIPTSEVLFEYGRGFHISDKGVIRGVELSVSPQWLWFRDAKVTTLTTTSVFYLPRDWMWTLSVTAARSSFEVVGVEWQPGGSTRLSFPLHADRLRGSVFFGVGAENYAKADEVGHFAARTFGGGLKYQINRRQEIGMIVAYQARSQQRTQTSVGFTYGIRF